MTISSKSDQIALLGRVRDALASHPADADETSNPLAELDAEIARIGKLAVPWPFFLHVALIVHEGGIMMLAGIGHHHLLTQAAAFCRRQWGEINDSRDPATLDDETVTRDYFNGHPEDRLQSAKLRVDPETGIDREELEFGNYLALSTSHVSGATADLLEEWSVMDPEWQPIEVASTRYGWFVPTLPEQCRDPALPADLVQALAFTRDEGCTYLLLDRDAATTERLPIFDW